MQAWTSLRILLGYKLSQGCHGYSCRGARQISCCLRKKYREIIGRGIIQRWENHCRHAQIKIITSYSLSCEHYFQLSHTDTVYLNWSLYGWRKFIVLYSADKGYFDKHHMIYMVHTKSFCSSNQRMLKAVGGRHKADVMIWKDNQLCLANLIIHTLKLFNAIIILTSLEKPNS